MLKVKVSKLVNYTEELKTLVDGYETTALSIYQEMSNGEFGWHDDNSEKFFDELKTYKANIQLFIEELKATKDAYVAIAEKANAIQAGVDDIFCDRNYKDTIINSYNSSISSINSIKSRINNLSTYFCTYSEKNAIRNEANRLSNIASSLEQSKNKVESLFDKLIELEDLIKAKLSKLSASKFSELGWSKYIIG